MPLAASPLITAGADDFGFCTCTGALARVTEPGGAPCDSAGRVIPATRSQGRLLPASWPTGRRAGAPAADGARKPVIAARPTPATAHRPQRRRPGARVARLPVGGVPRCPVVPG